jgi:hypothetical protein
MRYPFINFVICCRNLADSKGAFYRISFDGRVGEHSQEFNEKDINF